MAGRRCREEIGADTYIEAVAAFRAEPPCPSCSEGRVFSDGVSGSCLQRYRCRRCRRRFNSPIGTVLESSKKDLPT